MARKMGADGNKLEADLLLHPELLTRDFILLTLQERKIPVDTSQKLEKDKLTDLYVQHVIPLPQRDLPKTRWGRNMEKKRGKEVKATDQSTSASAEGSRKRPHITFDGSSTSTTIKIKKMENSVADRLKPPPSGNTTNLIRRLSGPSNLTSNSTVSAPVKATKVHFNDSGTNQNSTPSSKQSTVVRLKPPPVSSPSGGTTVVKLKRAAPKGENEMGELQPSEAKKKIQPITWP